MFTPACGIRAPNGKIYATEEEAKKSYYRLLIDREMTRRWEAENRGRMNYSGYVISTTALNEFSAATLESICKDWKIACV